MKAVNILIAVVLFSVFSVGAFSLISSIYAPYGSSYSSMSGSYDAINNVTTEINTMTTQMSDSTASDFGFALGAWQSIKLMFNIPAIIKAMIDTIALEFGIPDIFVSALLAIIGIVITFAVISAVFRRNT